MPFHPQQHQPQFYGQPFHPQVGPGMGMMGMPPPPPPHHHPMAMAASPLAAANKKRSKASMQPLQQLKDVFRCAVCGVDSSGEISFVQHCRGKAHTSKLAKRFGNRAVERGDVNRFAGLLENDAGMIPILSEAARVSIETGAPFGNAGGAAPAAVGSGAAAGGSRDEANVQRVALRGDHEQLLRTALRKSSSDVDLNKRTSSAMSLDELVAPAPAPSIQQIDVPSHMRRTGEETGTVPPTDDDDEINAMSAASSGTLRREHAASAPDLTRVVGSTVNNSPSSSKQQQQRGGGGGEISRSERHRRPAFIPPPIATGYEEDRLGGPLADQRRALPAFHYRDIILGAIRRNDVVVIEGETGCGKTTQVPQFVLDDCSQNGDPCSVVCTQPRRISALGVADRVASERGEAVGDAVGYSVRLDNKTSRRTCLCFCTTGILLKRLEEDASLAGVTHVVVDEVHERTIESDFLLMVLRDLLKRRKKAFEAHRAAMDGTPPPPPPLKVLLMSATCDVSLFCRYFQQFDFDVHAVSIPGRTFPVCTLYLEDAMEITNHSIHPRADWARKDKDRYGGGRQGPQGRREAPVSAPHPPRGGGGGGADLWMDPRRDADLTFDELARRYRGYSRRVADCLTKLDPDQIDYDLLADIVAWALSFENSVIANVTAKDIASHLHQRPDPPIPEHLLHEEELLLAEWGGAADGTAAMPQKRHANARSSDGAADGAWDDGAGGDRRPSPRAKKGRGDAAGSEAEAKRRATAAALSAPKAEARNEDADAVLVFLPGNKEIQTLAEALQFRHPAVCRGWHIVPLHGGLPPEEQKMAFHRPPPGMKKVVLATNVAETSITIDDVGFVIDTCRHKEVRYDGAKRMSSLEDVLVSKSNAKQRRGRAGRVKPGTCVHLVSRHDYATQMHQQQQPEVRRVPLEQLVLRVKALKYPGSVESVLCKLIQPPSRDAIRRAVRELVALDALALPDGDPNGAERLTSLGHHLSNLPVDVRIGKLILLGCVFGAVDETITIAAALASRSPFIVPFNEHREAADASRRAFALGQSDHLAVLNAYRQFDDAPTWDHKSRFCRDRFLGMKTLVNMGESKRHMLELLSEANFVDPGLRARYTDSLGRRTNTDGCRAALGDLGEDGMDLVASPPPVTPDGVPLSVESKASLVKALLCASLYPQVVLIQKPSKPPKGGKYKHDQLKFQIHAEEDGESDTASSDAAPAASVAGGTELQPNLVHVAVHPSSVNSKEGDFDSTFLVFHEKVKTTRVYVRDTTCVSPHALMLFAGGSLAGALHNMMPPPQPPQPPPGMHGGRGGGRGGRGGRGAVAAYYRAMDRYQHELRQYESQNVVLSVDGWIKFAVPASQAQLYLDVRNQLELLLRHKIERPHTAFGENDLAFVEVVSRLLKDH